MEAPGALVQEEAESGCLGTPRLHSDELQLTAGHSKPLQLVFLLYKIRDKTPQMSNKVLRTTRVNKHAFRHGTVLAPSVLQI